MSKGIAACGGCLAILLIWAGCGLVAAWLIAWAWNMLIPTLFHGPRIDFPMAYALYVVLSLVANLVKPVSVKS